MKSKVLYLASQSFTRKELLTQADIPFTVIGQDADESACDWNQPIDLVVQAIAMSKMEHVVLSDGTEGETCFVLTADTLVQSSAGKLYGKPIDYDDAVKTLHELRDGVRVVTGFCCAKKVWTGNAWEIETMIQQVVSSAVVVDIPGRWIPVYLEQHPYPLQTAGVLFVEGHGAQFIKSVNGSYTAILGLPIYEVRQALEKLGFFDSFFDRLGE